MYSTNYHFYSSKNYLYGKPVKGLRGYGLSYGFSFIGMERNDEISGNGNSYTTEFRQYDPRLGRWFSIDPEFKAFAWQSPYVAFDNNPISKTDPRGDAPGDGEKRAEKAKEIDKKDTRTYDSKSERKSGDTKVDCSEFATEVQNATGYTGGGTKEVPGKASVQAATFKATGEYSTKLKDVKLGDQVFFKKSGEINHTGIVSEIDKDGNIYVTHATVNDGKPGSIMTNKLNSDGSIPYWKNTFVGAGRPKLTQSTATTTAETTQTTTTNKTATPPPPPPVKLPVVPPSQ